MHDVFARFDQFDTRLNRWLVTHSILLLRLAMGGIFVLFGVLKFFPGVSPIEDLATRTTAALSFGLVTGTAAMTTIAALECVIGLCFLSGRFLRSGVWLLGAQMLGAMSPLVLFPSELFAGPGHAPTLVAQYIIKDVVLIGAGFGMLFGVLSFSFTGGRRDFTSASQIVASQYQVLAQAEVANQARNTLRKLPNSGVGDSAAEGYGEPTL